jgi:hypothetical protein
MYHDMVCVLLDDVCHLNGYFFDACYFNGYFNVNETSLSYCKCDSNLPKPSATERK